MTDPESLNIRKLLKIVRDPTVTPDTLLPSGQNVAEFAHWYLMEKAKDGRQRQRKTRNPT